MTSKPQEPAQSETRTQEGEHDEPNEYGFAGGATAPTPEPGTGESSGEAVAVPGGDLTGALTEAVDDRGHHDEEPRHG